MNSKINVHAVCTGLAAGAVNGLLGTGGGIILVHTLSRNQQLDSSEVFPCSMAIMLPVSILTAICTFDKAVFQYPLLPYSLMGGIVGSYLSKVKPLSVTWLHKIFGILVIAGGVRFLC